jgi:Mn2+/Fe2+ NRAMP family transporter
LRRAIGDAGPYLFAIGLIGAGMVALPVLVASMAYSLSEAMGWRMGLSEHPWEAKSFYVVISVTVFAAGVLNFLPVNPVRAAYLSQVLAGMLAIPILLFILLLANDRRVMRTANSRWQNFWCGAAIGALASCALLLGWWKVSK